MTVTTEAHKDDDKSETFTLDRFHVAIMYIALIHWSTVTTLQGRWNRRTVELISYFRARFPWLLDNQRRPND